MSAREINFDGLIGPTHNYAGLSLGNVASAANVGLDASPCGAALQGLEKMRTLLALGLEQGFLPPPPRPNLRPLREIGFAGTDDTVLAAAAREEPEVFHAAVSASSMWTANAATVIAAADSADSRLHLITANLARMMHRSFEARDTYETLARVFPDTDHFRVHAPLPYGQHFGDEGAANHMRLCARHATPGLNVFVYGPDGAGRFPARQAARASRAVARLAGLPGERALFATQSARAVDAGAFHNDVVAVANENMLLIHADALENQGAVLDEMRRRVPELHIHEVAEMTLQEAVASYLFNSQIVTLPGGEMAIVVPREVEETPAAAKALARLIEADNPVIRAVDVEVRESMRNGGGPACLRLRVPVCEKARSAIDSSYLLDQERVERLSRLVEDKWPALVRPADLADPAFWAASRAASAALAETIAAFAPLRA